METLHTWQEICDLTVKRLQSQLDKNKDEKRFRKWFMKREKVGWRFSEWMVYRMFQIWKELQLNLDHFIVNSGREGFGKSTLAMNEACWIDPEFDLKNGVIYEVDRYVDIMLERLKEVKEAELKGEKVNWRVLVLDEGTELLSKDSTTSLAKDFQKVMLIQRVLKFCIIINIPNFFMLTSDIRLHRVRTLIDLNDKGSGWFFGDKKNRSIAIVSSKGAKLKHIQASWVPVKWKRLFGFTLRFPDTLSFKEYSLLKLDGVGRTLDGIVENRDKRDKKAKNAKEKKA